MTSRIIHNTLAAAFVLSTLMACTSNGMTHGAMPGLGLSNPWERGENAFGNLPEGRRWGAASATMPATAGSG
jgi:hypothetical protein